LELLFCFHKLRYYNTCAYVLWGVIALSQHSYEDTEYCTSSYLMILSVVGDFDMYHFLYGHWAVFIEGQWVSTWGIDAHENSYLMKNL